MQTMQRCSRTATRLLARRLCSSSSVDDKLQSVLAQVAQRVRTADEARASIPTGRDTSEIPGVQSEGPKMLLRFTCTYEACPDKPTIARIISKASYEKGVVLVRCPSCDMQHLIADHLGWLSEPGTTIESIMAERGEEVQRLLQEGEDIISIE